MGLDTHTVPLSAASNPTAAQEIIARQRKRKRRPERATDGTTYLPLRDSSGALRALQEACFPPMRLMYLIWVGLLTSCGCKAAGHSKGPINAA